MVALLKRQLTDEEKAVVLQRHDRRCFANGHAIPEGEQVQYDHIHAHSRGGDSELNNVAPMCPQHNRDKGSLSLGDFRVKLQIDDFFSTGDKLTLRHLLVFLKQHGKIADFGRSVAVRVNGNAITMDSASGSMTHNLYIC